MMVTPPLLEVEDLHVQFGGVAAVQHVHFHVQEKQIVSLIGPNGAGKTTFVNAITGFVPPNGGRVRFIGRDITGRRPEFIATLGLVRTFQNAAIFSNMTVADNLAAGRFLKTTANVCQTLLRTPAFRREERETGAYIDDVLGLLRLRKLRDVIAGELPYGDQRVLGVGIALMARPKLLILDEPAAGLSPNEAQIMTELIRAIHREGTTILLIEHNMSVVMSVSDLIVVLRQGKKLAEGVPEAIRKHPEVVEAYLGVEP